MRDINSDNGIDREGCNRMAEVFATKATQKSVAPGSTIVHQGEATSVIYRIRRGCVRTCVYSQDGKRKILQFAGPGDFLGLSNETNWMASQEAVDTVMLEVIPTRVFEAEVTSDAVLQAAVRHSLVGQIEAHAALLVMTAQTTAVERVRSFLRQFAARRASAGFIALPMGRRDIADYLGLSMETVSRAFSSLRARGDIALKGANFFRIVETGDPDWELADAA